MLSAMSAAIAWLGAAALWMVLVLALFLASTLVFDAIHWLLHRFHASDRVWLQRLGALHEVHHRFLGRDLRIHDEFAGANLRHHVLPEFATHLAFSLGLLPWLPAPVVGGTVALQTAVAGFILSRRGRDPNHVGVDRVPAYRPMLACVPPYHWLHHRYPDAHFSSYLKCFDYLAGSGISLRGRRVSLVAGSTPFARELRRQLEASGVAEVRECDARRGAPEETDILVFDADAAGCDGRQRIAHFVDRAAERRFPAEVWAVAPAGDDGRFGRFARRCYDDTRVIYRHIPRAGSERAAQRAFFWIRRGFNYVPTDLRTAIGFARFRWGLRSARG